MLQFRDRRSSLPDQQSHSSSANLLVQPPTSMSPWAFWRTDLQAVMQQSTLHHRWEALFYSPGFQALTLHRIAHQLYRLRTPLLPRFISQINRWLTGIEIHPGAQIGMGVFIAHGMGVVIGETAIVGDGTTIYQDVTLGGTGKETGKRHPTLGQQVVVEAGAKVLGNIQIGDRVRIGAGSIVLRDVPDDSIVVGVPGRVIYRGKSEKLSSDELLPDLEAQVIQILFERLKTLETQIHLLKSELQPFEADYIQFFEGSPTQTQATQSPLSPKVIAQSNQLIDQFLDGAGI